MGAMFPDPQTGEMVHGIGRVRYTHEAMADKIIVNPAISQNDLAAHFGFSPAWISRIINSDAFRAYLHKRKEELEDPELKAQVEARMLQIEEQLKTIADLAMNRIIDRLSGVDGRTGLMDIRPIDDDFLLKTATMAKDALGYGARSKDTGDKAPMVVINMPTKAPSTADWISRHNATSVGGVQPHGPALPHPPEVVDAEVKAAEYGARP